MDVILALLRDRVDVDGTERRCSIIPNPRRSSLSITTLSGQKVNCSVEMVFRVFGAPVVGSTLTFRDGTVARVAAVHVSDQPGPWMRHARVYAATRADILGGPTDDALTFVPSAVTVDVYGTRARVPDDTAAFEVLGRIDPVDAGESTADGQRSARTWTLTVDADLSAHGVDAWAQVIGPDGTEYALDGDPIVAVDATGLPWSTASLRSWGSQPTGS